ncbi:MAG: hypothetical protein RL398_948 [Planctomycetota bacterium]
MRNRLVVMAVLAATACTKQAPQQPQTPALPIPAAPTLVPHEKILEALAAKGPQPPASAQLDQLVEMCTLAFAENPPDRRLAGRSASALRDDANARWALEEAIRHEDPAIRRGALNMLTDLGLQASLPPLLMRLKYELEPTTRLQVLRALALHGNGSGLAEVVASFSRVDLAPTAGAIAIEILQRADRDPGESPSWERLSTDLTALADVWAKTGSCASLPQPKPEPELLQARLARHLTALTGFQLRPVDDARFVVGRSGTLGLELLRPCLLAAEPYLRSHALEIARELGEVATHVADAVTALLGDPLTRAEAARTLGRMRVAGAAPLLRAWLQHPQLEVRCAAAGALGLVDDGESLPALRSLMDDSTQSMDLRVQAAFSVAVVEAKRGGRAFLRARLADGSYHEPTLRELLDAVERQR